MQINITSLAAFTDMTSKTLEAVLPVILVRAGFCSSQEEAATITQAAESEAEDGLVSLSQALQEYLGITEQEARLVQEEASQHLWGSADLSRSESESEADEEQGEAIAGKSDDDDDDYDDEDDKIIGDGECVLCERYIQVTKHHLIPKSTWSRVERSFRNAILDTKHPPSHFLGTNDNGFLLEGVTDVKEVRRNILTRTCDVCRPCHSTIHRTHDNMTLAIHFNTVEKLLTDEKILKFCKWANKQRPGKYARRDKIR